MQFSDLDLNKTYTYADYLKWTFDERLELIKGKIFPMSPASAEIHQRVFGKAGVKEYWIIHPQEKTFFKYVLDKFGKFQPTNLLTFGDEVTSPILPGFALNLDEVFADRLGGTNN